MEYTEYTEYTELMMFKKDHRQNIGSEMKLIKPLYFLIKYRFSLMLNGFILLTLTTSLDILFQSSITLLAKLNFETSLFTLTLYNFIESPLV